jgi:hypothetical protein
MPITPPITPPTACSAAQPMTPPELAKALVDIKKKPIRQPAIAAETIEIVISLVTRNAGFLKELLYPINRVAKSKKMLATVNPKNCIPPLSASVISVAIKPIMVIAPNFFIHHTANIRIEKPMRSHRKGNPNMLKNTGASNLFNTAQRAEHIAIAAVSRVLK